MKKPELFSDVDKYQLDITDFSTYFDKLVFSAIYNLYTDGATEIHVVDIDNYLQNNEVAKKTLDEENGIQFLQDCEVYSDAKNFNYYYTRLKKINLLKDLEKNGTDIGEFYSDNPINPNHTEINERFDRLCAADIINKLKNKIDNLEKKYSLNSVVEESYAYDGVRDLIKSLKEAPEVGIKLQGDIFNTVVRGGRKGKLYLRSASSGVGKTRNAVGDACNIAYPIRYEERYGRWVATGGGEKVLYVMTEQDTSEIQTMILAYLTGINEEKFLYGTYDEDDERIGIALQIMEQYKDNFLFARIPDPCASVIKNLFRRYNLQYGVENFFYDYIFSSPAMLEEYRDLKLPEYVCLRLFTTALKNLAIELNSFIMTSTQISNDDEKGGFKDYHNIQGARAIVNLVDFASIISRPTEQELDTIRGFERNFNIMPNCVTDVFKNRSGRWTMIRIWSLVDLGILRKQDLFVTTANTKPIDDFQIMEFSENIPEEVLLLEEELNLGIKIDTSTGEIAEDIDQIKIINNNNNNNEKTFVDEICAAFGNQEQMKERFKEMDLDDLL